MIPLPANFKLIAIAGAILIAFGTGWKVHGWKYDAALNKGLQDMLAQQEVNDKYARNVVTRLQNKQAEQVIIYRTLKSEVKDVTDNRVCFANNAALGVWNNALIGTVPEAATGTAETPTPANTATDQQILDNAVANFEQAKQIRDQLNSLIDWHEKK